MNNLPPYLSASERIWHYAFWLICIAVLFFVFYDRIVGINNMKLG